MSSEQTEKKSNLFNYSVQYLEALARSAFEEIEDAKKTLDLIKTEIASRNRLKSGSLVRVTYEDYDYEGFTWKDSIKTADVFYKDCAVYIQNTGKFCVSHRFFEMKKDGKISKKQRHISLILKIEEIDPETGEPK